MMSDFSGGTSIQKLTAAFRDAMADDAVGSIVFQIDSPGGSVYGVKELADEIYEARGQGKQIIAVADPMAASAAYHIASAADEIVVLHSGEVGSIGVLAAHVDYSEAEEKCGVKTTLISAGKFKVEGNPYEPLTDDARAAIQSDVDDYYELFVDAVARNRGVSAQDVITGYGEGRCLTAKNAVAAGLADRIDTFDNVISGLLAPDSRSRARHRATEQLKIKSA